MTTLEQRYARLQRLRATPEWEAYMQAGERFVAVQDRTHTEQQYQRALTEWHEAEVAFRSVMERLA